MRQKSALLGLLAECIRYKTIDKYADRIVDGDNYRESVNIAYEVRYVWNRYSSELVKIENVAGAYMYIPGVSKAKEICSGDINIEQYSKDARISQTCLFVYEVDGVSKTVGNDYNITTRANTFVININESDLY